MASKPNYSELQILESYRHAFENGRNQPLIKSLLASFGYTDEKLDEGWLLYQDTHRVWLDKKREDVETSESYNQFKALFDALEQQYIMDRKKLKVAFMWAPEVLKKLNVNGERPQAYLELMDSMQVCYATLNSDLSLQTKVAHMQLTPEHISASLARLEAIAQARSLYLRENSESQAATELKDQAFAKLDRWMREYLAVARIALEEQPQLLEALGLLVRN